jgi:F-type H+-transporting ATPase subunit a
MRNRILTILGVVLVIGAVLYFAGIKLTKNDLTISAAAEPLFFIGSVPFTNSFFMTLVVDVLLILTIIFGARNMQLIPQGFQNTLEAIVEAFYNFAQSIDRKNVGKFFPLCATIFFFVLYSNLFALVPGVGSIGVCEEKHAAEAAGEAKPAEPVASAFSSLPGYCNDGEHHVVPYLRSPSADLNVTLAMALISVLMIQVFGVQALGANYFTKFFNFKEGAIGFAVGIIELISELARILSFAFRLFGNIFAGEVILIVMSFLFPYLLPLPFYGLELFVAFMQAIIFSVLTMVFMSIATQAHGGHDEHGHDTSLPLEAGDVPGHTGH